MAHRTAEEEERKGTKDMKGSGHQLNPARTSSTSTAMNRKSMKQMKNMKKPNLPSHPELDAGSEIFMFFSCFMLFPFRQ